MGRLEVIVGCMFSGKTEELLRRLRRHEIAGDNILVIKPRIDSRYSDEHVQSHSGQQMNALILKSLDYVYVDREVYKADVVGIDEIQFFSDYWNKINWLLKKNKKVIITGLDTTFRNEPFGDIGYLLAVADKIDKLTAICNVCGNEATRTQRLIDGEPATYDSPTILVGGLDSYEARCNECHRIG